MALKLGRIANFDVLFWYNSMKLYKFQLVTIFKNKVCMQLHKETSVFKVWGSFPSCFSTLTISSVKWARTSLWTKKKSSLFNMNFRSQVSCSWKLLVHIFFIIFHLIPTCLKSLNSPDIATNSPPSNPTTYRYQKGDIWSDSIDKEWVL